MDLALVAILLVLMTAGYRLAYSWGREVEREQWERRIDWYRDVMTREARPATRHPKESATERTFPYRGEVE